MAAENQDFKMWQGEDKYLNFCVKDTKGDPVDLSGSNVIWKMRRQVYNSTEPEIRKDTNNGITIIDPAGGVFRVRLRPNDTKTIPKGYYLHEAEVTDISGNVVVVTVGTVELMPSIIE